MLRAKSVSFLPVITLCRMRSQSLAEGRLWQSPTHWACRAKDQDECLALSLCNASLLGTNAGPRLLHVLPCLSSGRHSLFLH
ncbi:unnamed protein product [Ixodes persulcatus]